MSKEQETVDTLTHTHGYSFNELLNTITLGDSYKLIKEIPDNSIDLVVIDPPYLIETDGAGMFGNKSNVYKNGKPTYLAGERYVMRNIDFMKNGIDESILEELSRVMKKINIYIWCSQKQLFQYIDYFVNRKKCNWNLLCWHKTDPVPACGNKYLTDTEYCLFFRQKGVRVFGEYHTKRTFYVSKKNSQDKKKYKHPTIKPISIIKNLITNSSNEGDIILDCFSGSGTTCVACKELNRQFIGIEINPEYHRISMDRLNGILANGQLSFDTDISML